jgi:hypothetical protein
MEKVDFDTAQNAVNQWLDAKKIRTIKREAHSEYIEDLVSAVQEGVLIVNDDNTLTQKLAFPVGPDESIDELKYKSRLKGAEMDKRMKGVKPGDGDGRLNAMIAALTGQTINIPRTLDSSTDKSLALSIAVFFL